MKKLLLTLSIIFFAVCAFAQPATSIPGSFRYKRTIHDSVNTIPGDTVDVTGDFGDAHNLAVMQDSVLWIWSPTLNKYILPRTGAGVVAWADIVGSISGNAQLRDSFLIKQPLLPFGTNQQFIAGDWTLIDLDSLLGEHEVLHRGDSIITNLITNANTVYTHGLYKLDSTVYADYGLAIWNADRLQGFGINPVQPLDGQVLVFDADVDMWVPTTFAGGGGGSGGSDTLFVAEPLVAIDSNHLMIRYANVDSPGVIHATDFQAWYAKVTSVSGDVVDNTDPQNPIITVHVDGSTITGTGTEGDPLVASQPLSRFGIEDGTANEPRIVDFTSGDNGLMLTGDDDNTGGLMVVRGASSGLVVDQSSNVAIKTTSSNIPLWVVNDCVSCAQVVYGTVYNRTSEPLSNGYGISTSYVNMYNDAGTGYQVGQTDFVWFNSSAGSEQGGYRIKLSDNGGTGTVTKWQLSGTGQVTQPQYGSGAFGGTLTYLSGYDAGGNVIEIDPGTIGGGGGSDGNGIYDGGGALTVNTTVDLDDKFIDFNNSNASYNMSVRVDPNMFSVTTVDVSNDLTNLFQVAPGTGILSNSSQTSNPAISSNLAVTPYQFIIQPWQGEFFIDSLDNTTTSYNLYWDPTTQKVTYGAAAGGGGGGSLANFYLKDSTIDSDRTVNIGSHKLSFNNGDFGIGGALTNKLFTVGRGNLVGQYFTVDTLGNAISAFSNGSGDYDSASWFSIDNSQAQMGNWDTTGAAGQTYIAATNQRVVYLLADSGVVITKNTGGGYRLPINTPTDGDVITYSAAAGSAIWSAGGGGGGGSVLTVTGLNTDNSDPTNPVIQISVDGSTITGDGTPGNPLVSSGGGGVTAFTTFGSSPNANGGSVSGSNIILQPADATHPGGLTTGTQTIAGVKTFNDHMIVGSGGANIFLANYYESANPFLNIQNSSTGTSSGDGLALGVIGSTNGYLGMQDNMPMWFYTNAIARMKIAAGGDVSMSENFQPAKLVTIGATNKFQLQGDYAGGGEFGAGSLLGSLNNTDLSFFPDLTNGTAGAKVKMGYFAGGGGGVRSAVEVANVASGFSNLLLMKSGGFVGINQSTPTAKLQINTDANSVTQSDANGLLLANASAATVGLQSISPPTVWQANGWKTNATAGSQDVRFSASVLPIQGSANPTGSWRLQANINGAGYSNVMTVSSGGTIGTTSVSASAAITAGTVLTTAGFKPGYVAKTTTYTITTTDFFIDCTSGSFTVTLPTAVGVSGQMYVIKNSGGGTITLATTSSQTIDGAGPGTVATVTRFMSDGAGWKTF